MALLFIEALDRGAIFDDGDNNIAVVSNGLLLDDKTT